jgi:uncharacterized membrane protein YfcA
MLSPWETIGLTASALAAGVINSFAGGGTLLTFPTLLAFGMPPVNANATSTLALLIGTASGTFGNRQFIRPILPWLWRFAPVSVIGGLLGSALLTHTSNRIFARLVPFLILFATILFLAQGFFRRFAISHEQPGKPETKLHVWGAILFQFAVAVYGGYFGAGIGILMLATLGFIGMGNIYEMNTLKTILAALINLMAAVWFIFAGLIEWPQMAVMTVGALIGYYFGSHFAQRVSQERARQIITAIGFIISALTFWKEFVK